MIVLEQELLDDHLANRASGSDPQHFQSAVDIDILNLIDVVNRISHIIVCTESCSKSATEILAGCLHAKIASLLPP